MGKKPKRKLTAAEKKAKASRRLEYETVFMNGKQKRIKRVKMIDGMSEEDFMLRNADPVWLAQNELWEYIDMDWES